MKASGREKAGGARSSRATNWGEEGEGSRTWPGGGASRFRTPTGPRGERPLPHLDLGRARARVEASEEGAGPRRPRAPAWGGRARGEAGRAPSREGRALGGVALRGGRGVPGRGGAHPGGGTVAGTGRSFLV